MGSRNVFLFVLACVLSVLVAPTEAFAQPSDATVLRDLRGPGQLSLTLAPRRNAPERRGLREWVFLRGAEVTRASDIPGVTLRIVVQAYYTSTDGRSWRFVRTLVTSNGYVGLEPPTAAEIDAVLRAHPEVFFQQIASGIVGRPVRGPTLIENPRYSWTSPNRVSFQMVAEYDYVVSYTDVARVRRVFNVALERPDRTQPWASYSIGLTNRTEELQRRSFTSELVDRMTRYNAVLAGQPSRTPEEWAQSAGTTATP